MTGAGGLAGIVLAAGSGTRLRPLTHFRPKALCPVGDRPLVDHAIDRLAPLCAALAVNVHHGTAQMLAHLDGRVHLSVERPVPLGTAGAVGALRGWLDGRAALIANADSWHSHDLRGLVEDWDGQRVRLLVTEDAMRGDFGPWRFAGASLLPWCLARDLEAEPSGLYESCWRDLAEQDALDLVPATGSVTDCGTPADYLAANLHAAGGSSVVGAGAVVDGELVRSVVWPGGGVRSGERLVEAIRIGSAVTVQVAARQARRTRRARGPRNWKPARG